MKWYDYFSLCDTRHTPRLADAYAKHFSVQLYFRLRQLGFPRDDAVRLAVGW